MATKEERSIRFGIEALENGHEDNPTEEASAAFGDPVNFFYLVTDKVSAEEAKVYFRSDVDSGLYTQQQSIGRIESRLNRLSRKFGVGPFEPGSLFEAQPHKKKLTKLFAPIQLSKNNDGKPYAVIPASRNAVFDHPRYGRVWFDQDLFDSFRDNFESGVVGTDLAINAEHGRNGYFGGMALAWIDKLYTQDDVFHIGAEPTPTGDAVIGSEYKYASIEYMDNFVDQETGVSYGPTLVGCACTNIPFVHRNKPIRRQSFEIIEEGDIDMPQDNPTLPANPEEEKPSSLAKPATEKEHGASKDVQLLMDRVNRAEATNSRLLEELKTSKISTAIMAATQRGVPPVILSVATQMLSHCDPLADKTIDLDLGEGSDKYNFFEAVVKLLTIAPGRDLGQTTVPAETLDNARDDQESDEAKTLEEAEEKARAKRK